MANTLAPGQFSTESGKFDPSDPAGAAGNWGQATTPAGMTRIGTDSYTWNDPKTGQEYLYDPALAGTNYYGGKYGEPTLSTSPWGDQGILASQANEWGLKNNPGDFFSNLGPGILGLPFLAAAGGELAFGGGFNMPSFLGGTPSPSALGDLATMDTGIAGGVADTPITAIPGISDSSGLNVASADMGTMTDAPPVEAGTLGADTLGSTDLTGNLGALPSPYGTFPTTPTGLSSDALGPVNDVSSGIGASSPIGIPGMTNIKDFLKENKNLILPGVSMAASLAKKPDLGTGNLNALAGQLGSATSLIPSVSTGHLPPGAETSVSNALNSAHASIKSKYAQMGLSGSTMEAQELSQADANAEAMRFQLSQQLTQTGLQAAGLDASIYNSIMQATLQQDQALQNALASFASSAALGAGLSRL